MLGMRMRGLIPLLLLGLLAGSSFAQNGTFIPVQEGYLSASYPEIVVARWLGPDGPEKEPIDFSNRLVSIEVLETLKGKFRKGRHKLRVRFLLGQDPLTGFSMVARPDVRDPSEPAIWFLRYPDGRANRAKGLATAFEIQPLELKALIEVLIRPNRKRAIGGFLRTHEGILAIQTLKVVAGYSWVSLSTCETSGKPWSPKDVAYGQALDEPIPSQWLAVRNKLASPYPQVRMVAARSLASLIGPKSIPYLRPLLADSSPDVRLLAVELLAYFRDARSYREFEKAVPKWSGELGVDRYMECEATLRQLMRIGGASVLAATAKFLAVDCSNAEGLNSSGPSVAILAHRAICETAGYEFPFDPEACIKAFNGVKGMPKAKWPAALLRVLGDYSIRLGATVERKDGFLSLTLTNLSKHPVRLQCGPIQLELTQSQTWGETYISGSKDLVKFITLGPEASASMKASLKADEADPIGQVKMEIARVDAKNRLVSWVGSIPCHWVR